jgi:hypothetical protein
VPQVGVVVGVGDRDQCVGTFADGSASELGDEVQPGAAAGDIGDSRLCQHVQIVSTLVLSPVGWRSERTWLPCGENAEKS